VVRLDRQFGHLIGTVAGYFSLVVTGLTAAGPAIANGVTRCRFRFGAHLLRQPKALMILTRNDVLSR